MRLQLDVRVWALCKAPYGHPAPAGSYIPGTLLHDETQAVAGAVLADLDGAGTLADVEKLVEFADAEMAKIRGQA